MNRRQFIRGAAGVGALAMVGAPASGSVPAPDVPTEKLQENGWKQIEQAQETVFESSFGGVEMSVTGHTVVYENRELRREIAEKTVGEVDFTPSSFFATRLEFSTPISALPDTQRSALEAETDRSARTEFEERLRDLGLVDVEAGETDELVVETGEVADRIRYGATYEVEEFSVPIGGEELTLAPDPFAVAGQLALWEHSDAMMVTGGGYPAENFAQTLRESVTDAIDVTVEIDLGLDPEAYETELVSLMKAVK